MGELSLKPSAMYNVGVMMPYMDYIPRTLEEIIEVHADYPNISELKFEK